jgi:hypothetical protein
MIPRIQRPREIRGETYEGRREKELAKTHEGRREKELAKTQG